MERIPKMIKFPVDLVERVQTYQKENFITSFAAAVYELIRIGLETQKRNQ